MTIPSIQRFSKAIVGQMMAGADVNIFATHVIAQYPVGQGCQGASGEIYRYCSFDGPTAPGTIVGPNLGNVAQAVLSNCAVASPVTVQAEYPITPNTIGSHHVQITQSSITANQYQGGKLILTYGTGSGYTYDIKGNTATGNPAAGTIDIQTVQPLQANLSPNTSIIVAPSMYNDVTACSVGTNWQVAGVTLSQTGQNSVQSNNNLFGWIQTKGVVACLEDDAATIKSGQAITLSGNKVGYYSLYGQSGTIAYSVPAIGQSVRVNGTTGGYGAIYLILE